MLIREPKNLGLDPFPDPVGHFGAPLAAILIFAGGSMFLIKGVLGSGVIIALDFGIHCTVWYSWGRHSCVVLCDVCLGGLGLWLIAPWQQ